MAGLIEFIRSAIERNASPAGIAQECADELAAAIEKELRDEYAGGYGYVASSNVAERNLLVRKEFNGKNRDEVCARHGISRRTFYRIVKE